MSHIDRKIREKGAVRKNILDATLRIATKEGWYAVTIRKIADMIEYTPPVFYEHFENKGDLIQELISNGFRLIKTEMDKAMTVESDPAKLLIRISLIHWEFAFKNEALFQLMFSMERPHLTSEMTAFFEVTLKVFRKLTDQGKELADELMFNWACLVNGYITMTMRIRHAPKMHRKNARELYLGAIERFLKGID